MAKLNNDYEKENIKAATDAEYKAIKTIIEAAQTVIDVTKTVIVTTPEAEHKALWSDARIIDAFDKYKAIKADAQAKVDDVYARVAEADLSTSVEQPNTTPILLAVHKDTEVLGEINLTTDI